jgi:hypothetical protein
LEIAPKLELGELFKTEELKYSGAKFKMHFKNPAFKNPALRNKLAEMRQGLEPFVSITSGDLHPAFPPTMLHYWLLSEADLPAFTTRSLLQSGQTSTRRRLDA